MTLAIGSGQKAAVEMDDLERRVFNFIQERCLIEGADRLEKGGGHRRQVLLVGVSGGPDSVCLLSVLNAMKKPLRLDLHVLHVNHMLRGASSDEDERYVAQLCEKLDVPLTVGRCDVPAYRREYRLSVEEAARDLRYDFFSRSAQGLGANVIALGHTQDDQVETILMHLIRGTGLTGLRGMEPTSIWKSTRGESLTVIRPLIEVTREETEEYCRIYGLNPRSDVSNYSLDHVRNRIRHKLIPLLRSYNRKVDAALLRTSRAAGDDLLFIESHVSEAWDRVISFQPNGLLVNTKEFMACHPAIKRHLLRRAVRQVLGDLVDIHSIHIEKMMEAISKPVGRRIILPRGIRFSVGYDSCLVSKGDRDECPLPDLDGEYRLSIPGNTDLPGWQVMAAIQRPSSASVGSFEACIDLDKAGSDMYVRHRRPGDRFQPLGMDAEKKLQDFMVDAKIPRHWRDKVPLVCSSEGIVWVVGWRIAEWAKVTDRTKRVLLLGFKRV